MVVVGPVTFAAATLSGLVLGSLFALMAMGLSLIYSTVRVLNFSHGAFFMAGAFIVWWLNTPYSDTYGTTTLVSSLNVPLWVALVPAVIAIFGLGVATQRGIIRPLVRKPGSLLTTLTATLALAYILESIATLIFGGYRQQFSAEIAVGSLRYGGLTITYAELVQFGVAVGVLVILHQFLKRARFGIGMRAVAQDMDAAHLCSINTNTVYLLTFGLGAALAAVAGFLLTNTVFIAPSSGWEPLTIAFIIVVFGGIGSVGGTIVASYIISVVQQYVAIFLDPHWGLVFAFILMLIALIIRPRGLFGFKET